MSCGVDRMWVGDGRASVRRGCDGGGKKLCRRVSYVVVTLEKRTAIGLRTAFRLWREFGGGDQAKGVRGGAEVLGGWRPAWPVAQVTEAAPRRNPHAPCPAIAPDRPSTCHATQTYFVIYDGCDAMA